MYGNLRHLIEELGGRRAVAARVGIAGTTLHDHIVRGLLPPKFYAAFCDLAAERGKPFPERKLFDFAALPDEQRGAA